MNNHAHVLKARKSEWGSFLFHSLVNKDIRRFINGTTRSKLTQADLLQIQIAFPSVLEEARAIAAMLDAIEAAIERRRAERDALAVQKASTTDVLLTGRVRMPLEARTRHG